MKLLRRLFPFRAKVRDLEARIKKLETLRDIPALYNNYKDFPDMDIPLGIVSSRHFHDLNSAGIAGMLKCAKDSIDHEFKTVFNLYLETTEGVFVRTLESDAEREVTQSEEDFSLTVHWEPIHVGKSMTILDSAIVYDDKILNRFDRIHGLPLLPGDTLKLQYTFKAP